MKIQPVFISVDPERDTPTAVRQYVREFHPRLIGLTGDMDAVKKVSKMYRCDRPQISERLDHCDYNFERLLFKT